MQMACNPLTNLNLKFDIQRQIQGVANVVLINLII